MENKYILLTTNEAFAQHCGVCIQSVIENNINTVIHVVVASLNLSEQSKSKLRKMAELNQNLSITIVDFDEKKLDQVPQIGVYSKDIYLRLWVDEFFSELQPDKVLYLDADTIVVDDLNELWSLDLADNVIAAVNIPNAATHQRLGLPSDIKYFNSGVLLFNMPLWIENNCRQQLFDWLEENKETAKNPDQDALNACFYQQRITLDYTYNAISPFFRVKNELGLTAQELEKIRAHVKIVHFNGNARPWIYGCNHPYQKSYFKYLAKTPWANFVPPDKSLWVAFKKYMRKYIGLENFVAIQNLKGR